MFKERLRSIWTKIQNGDYVSLVDKFILYLNDLGYTGLLLGLFALVATFFSIGSGNILFVSYKTISIVLWTLFVRRNWIAIRRAYKKAWLQIFPNGLKLPSGNIIK